MTVTGRTKATFRLRSDSDTGAVWKRSSGLGDDAPLEAHLQTLLNQLGPVRDEFRLSDADFFCGLFAGDDGTTWMLSSDVCARLRDFGVDVIFDLYPGESQDVWTADLVCEDCDRVAQALSSLDSTRFRVERTSGDTVAMTISREPVRATFPERLDSLLATYEDPALAETLRRHSVMTYVAISSESGQGSFRLTPAQFDRVVASGSPLRVRLDANAPKAYTARYAKGTVARVARRCDLEEFRATWKYHHKLLPEQLELADCELRVRDVSYYHGGDPLYALAEAPGLWHEACLRRPRN